MSKPKPAMQDMQRRDLNAAEHDSMTSPTRKRRPGQRLTKTERASAQSVFLAAFANTANVRAACMKAGIERNTVYQWAEHDAEFSLRFKQAELDANDMIRGEMFRRGMQGVDEPVVSMGKVVYHEGKILTIKKYSDALLSLLAKARMPEFRDKQPDVTVNNNLSGVEIYKVRVPENGRD